MENYLYFRKVRPATFSYTVTSGDVTAWANNPAGTTNLITVTGLGGDDIDSKTEFASIVVTSAGANSNVGSAYTAPTEAGDTVTLTADVESVSNSNVTIPEATGTGSPDATNGYTFIAGDVITITLQQGLETSVAYPSSRYKSIANTNATTTTITFHALKNGDGEEDDIVLTHASGKYSEVVKMIDAALGLAAGAGSASTAPTGKFISVVDGSDGVVKVLKGYHDIAISGLVFTPTASY